MVVPNLDDIDAETEALLTEAADEQEQQAQDAQRQQTLDAASKIGGTTEEQRQQVEEDAWRAEAQRQLDSFHEATGSDDGGQFEKYVGDAQSVVDNTKGAGEGLYNVATGKEDVSTVSAGAGKELVNVATGGNAEEWRSDFWEQERKDGTPLAREKENIERELSSGGVVNDVAAFNTAARVGTDALLDNPSGPNVQEGTLSTVEGATGMDREEIAGGVQDWYTGAKSAKNEAIASSPLGGTQAGEFVGGAVDVFIGDPIKGATAGLTGIDAETGELNQRAEPANFYDAALIGGGSAAKGVVRGAQSARLARAGSKAGKGAKSAAKTARASPRAASIGASTAVSRMSDAVSQIGGKFSNMGKFSILDDALSTGRRVGDDVPAGAGDDAIPAVDDTSTSLETVDTASLDTLDESDTLSRTVGTGDEATRYGEDLTDTSTVLDEGISAGADSTRGGDTSIDEVISMERGSDSSFQMAEGGSSTIEDAATQLDTRVRNTTPSLPSGATTVVDDARSSVRNLASRMDLSMGPLSGGDEGGSTFTNLFSGGDESASTVDDTNVFRAGDDSSRATIGDETAEVGFDAPRFGDEGATTVDDAPRFGDESTTVSKTDDGLSGTTAGDEGSSLFSSAPSSNRLASFADDPIGSVSRWIGRRGYVGQGLLAGLGITAGADLLGIGLPGLGGDGPGERGPETGASGEQYRTQEVKSYSADGVDGPIAFLFEVQRGSEGTEWNQAGFAVMLGEETVLTPSATEAEISPVAGSGRTAVPSPRFNSEGEADDAVETYIAENTPDDEDSSTPDDPDSHPSLSGSISAPDSATRGEAFAVEWEASYSGSQPLSTRTMLAIQTDEGMVPAAEATLDFTAGGTQSGTFNVPQGWTAIDAGDYELYFLAMDGEQPAGAIASTDFTVDPRSEEDDDSSSSNWGDPQLVRELPGGWYLFAQPNTETEETRFMVVAKNSSGERIYLQEGGRVDTSPQYFPTPSAAAEALQKWAQRVNNGDVDESGTPDPNQSRPTPEQVKRDAADHDENSIEGLAGRARQYASKNPIKAAVGAAVALYAAYYIYEGGYLGGLTEVSL